MAAKKEEIEARRKAAKPEFETWLASDAAGLNPGLQDTVLHLPLTETDSLAHGTGQHGSVEWAGGKERRPGPFGPAPQIVEGAEVTGIGDGPRFTREGKASYGAFLYVEDKPSGAVFSRMNKAEGYRGWDLFLSEGRPTIHIIDQFPDTALKITAKEPLKPGQWHHVMAVFDGARKGAAALALYVDGREAAVEVNNNSLGSNIAANARFRLGSRSDGTGTTDPIKDGKVFLQDVRFYGRALTQVEVAQLAASGLARDYFSAAADQRTPEQRDALYEMFLAGWDKDTRELQAGLAKLKTEEGEIRQRGGTTLVMEEKKDTEPVAYVLVRGNYASKGAQVHAATPEALPAMKSELPRNRLGLARWIVSRDNPLMARVTVNRLWSELFGLGLVETTEDFGVMGARPSNQALLDWLAVEFMDSGWDFRHMVKTMVMSGDLPAICGDLPGETGERSAGQTAFTQSASAPGRRTVARSSPGHLGFAGAKSGRTAGQALPAGGRLGGGGNEGFKHQRLCAGSR